MNNYQQQSAGGDSGGKGGWNVCVLGEKDENGVTRMPNATPMVAVPGITFSQSSTGKLALRDLFLLFKLSAFDFDLL